MAEQTTAGGGDGNRNDDLKRRRSSARKSTKTFPVKKRDVSWTRSFLDAKNLSGEDEPPFPDPVHGECHGRGQHRDNLNGQLLNGAPYRLGVIIGTGYFGQVRIARHTTTNEQVAVKIERGDTNSRMLKNEWAMYKTLLATPTEGVPQVFDIALCGVRPALVIELLGPSLKQIYVMCKYKFSLHTILLIGIQLITRLEYVHSKKIVHRDVKPDNFLIRKPLNSDTTIFITDFGLSTYYVDPITKRHIAYQDQQAPVGTGRYMSLNTHKGIEQSRRDDLESLGYTLIYFLRGSLPWDGIRDAIAQELCKQIFEVKKTIPLEILGEGHPAEFVQYMEYIRDLKFDQTPNYNFLRRLFTQRLKREGLDPNGRLDWCNRLSDTSRMSAV